MRIMFENLISFDPKVLEEEGFVSAVKATPQQILEAQANTAAWLKDLGVDDDSDLVDVIEVQAAQSAARKAFTTLTTNATDEAQKLQLTRLKTPAAVQHLVGMLTAYDWEFVEQAKELRGYVVAQIIEETKNSNSSVRLKALTLLGKVTEVGLFTEKIEIKKTDSTDAELEQRIKDKLAKFIGVVDVEVTDVAEKQQTPEEKQQTPEEK